ncbi:MAG: segregation/condensation protein A [Hyphomonadaceae bacterium]|nr:segregation/condensation protein A [Hyphomonadaceae bacterium]
MTERFQEDLRFEAAGRYSDAGEAFILDIDGFEGPLHLLLELAQQQKVDLSRISVLELAEQYIAFIRSAQDLRIELAADYLVMAAWLTYLKSRFVLPEPESGVEMEEPDAAAAHLAFRLQRLEAMRRAADGLVRLPLAGRDVHVRGNPEGLRCRTTPSWGANLFDLISAYGACRSKAAMTHIRVELPKVMSVEDARRRLYRSLAAAGLEQDWHELDDVVDQTGAPDADIPRDSIRASSLMAGLELAREGHVDLRQGGVYTPIYFRARRDENVI